MGGGGTKRFYEPGARRVRAALTFHIMFRLKEYGLDRLWHWGFTDSFRNEKGTLKYLFNGTAWLMSILEYMSGGQAYLFEPKSQSSIDTKYMVIGSFKDQQTILLASAYNRDASKETKETLIFSVPVNLMNLENKSVRYVTLNRETDFYQHIRNDLVKANMLKQEFVEHPERIV